MIDAPTPIVLLKPQQFINFFSVIDKQTKIELKISDSITQIEFYAKIIDKNPLKEFYTKETESKLLKNAYLMTGGNTSGIFKILEYYIKKIVIKLMKKLIQ